MEPACQCTAPTEEMIDEDTKMEFTDIAMAVDGNDNGSDESEGEEAKGEVEEAVAVSCEGAPSDDDATEMQLGFATGTGKPTVFPKQVMWVQVWYSILAHCGILHTCTTVSQVFHR
jgi:hypothetical protein